MSQDQPSSCPECGYQPTGEELDETGHRCPDCGYDPLED